VLTVAGLTAAVARIGSGAEPTEAAQVHAERRFSCAAVGDKCNGKDSDCCSGRCKGKGARKGSKDKKGRRDRRDNSKCVAHDQGSCTADQDTCESGRIPCGRDSNGGCLNTTGNAPFCGQVRAIGSGPPLLGCEDCETDQECEDLNYGTGAACVVCESLCQTENGKATACPGAWD
jgi:hypothetical protein